MTIYYVQYDTRTEKNKITEHTSLETARRDAEALRSDPYFKNIRIVTGRGKKVSNQKRSRGIRINMQIPRFRF